MGGCHTWRTRPAGPSLGRAFGPVGGPSARWGGPSARWGGPSARGRAFGPWGQVDRVGQVSRVGRVSRVAPVGAFTCSADFTSLTPGARLASAIAFSASTCDFTLPDSVTTPFAVSTSIFVAPTSGSLSSAVLTAAVIVASSIVWSIVLLHAANVGGRTIRTRSVQRIVSALNWRSACPEPVDQPTRFALRRSAVASAKAEGRARRQFNRPSRLRAANSMEAGVDHHDLTGNRTRLRAQQEEGRVGDLALIHAAPEGRAIAIDLQDARETGDA